MCCVATEQQMELEICVHQTILMLQKKTTWNKMKWDSGSTSTQNATVSVSVALSQKERQQERAICVTLRVPGLVAGLCRYVSYWAPTCLVRHERAWVLLVCCFYLFIFYLNPLSPSPFLLIFFHSSRFVILSTSTIQFSLTSACLDLFPHLSVSASPRSLPPSVSLSSFSTVLTVWKDDESDCMWQSGIWVNLMWLIWCLLTVLWKSPWALIDSYILAQLCTLYLRLACLHGGCTCLLACVHLWV